MTATRQALAERITAYLAGGGLFNPEMADHDAVRDLLIGCRAALEASVEPASTPSPSSGAGEPSERVSISSVDDLREALNHCLMAAEMDLRHQGKALRDFALPALEYAVACQSTKDVA